MRLEDKRIYTQPLGLATNHGLKQAQNKLCINLFFKSYFFKEQN